MTPAMINGFATELVKTAGNLDMLKALAAGGKDKLIEWVSRHPTKAMALGGAGIGAATSDEGERLKGALAGGALGALGGSVGGVAGQLPSIAAASKRMHKLKDKYPGIYLEDAYRRADKAIRSRTIRDSLIGAGLGVGAGGLLGASHKKEANAMMGYGPGSMSMEQPAMGTGKGVKSDTVASKARAVGGAKGNSRQRFIASRNTKVAHLLAGIGKVAEEDDVQDSLSEMLAQAQYQPEPEQPFWADQGATMQGSVDDASYGHGSGLSKKKTPAPKAAPAKAPAYGHGKPAPKKSKPQSKPTKPAPKPNSPMPRPKMDRLPPIGREPEPMLAIKTAQQFLAGISRR